MGSEARKRARERLREERSKERRAARRKRTLIVLGAAAAVVVLIVGIGYAVLTVGGNDEYEGPLAPEALQEDGSVVMAQEGVEAPVVEVYTDYQCPACRQFEATNGDLVNEEAAEGEAIVHYRPVSVFAQDAEPTSGNSLRGGVAARAAADHDLFIEYTDILFENQPNTEQEGFSVGELEELFGQTGVSGEQADEFAQRMDEEAEVIDEFAQDFMPDLTEDAMDQIGEETLGTMVLSDLLSWGADHGHDPGFLEGTYTGEIIDATTTAYTRYSGDNIFRGTPSVYINGELLDGGETTTARDLSDAIASADADEVDTEPMGDGGDAD